MGDIAKSDLKGKSEVVALTITHVGCAHHERCATTHISYICIDGFNQLALSFGVICEFEPSCTVSTLPYFCHSAAKYIKRSSWEFFATHISSFSSSSLFWQKRGCPFNYGRNWCLVHQVRSSYRDHVYLAGISSRTSLLTKATLCCIWEHFVSTVHSPSCLFRIQILLSRRDLLNQVILTLYLYVFFYRGHRKRLCDVQSVLITKDPSPSFCARFFSSWIDLAFLPSFDPSPAKYEAFLRLSSRLPRLRIIIFGAGVDVPRLCCCSPGISINKRNGIAVFGVLNSVTTRRPLESYAAFYSKQR